MMMMMMNMMMKCTVVLLVAVVVPVMIQAQPDPCTGFSTEQCDQEEECTLFGLPFVCVSKIGKGSVARQGDNNRAYGWYSSVGGGQQNAAGDSSRDNSHSVVGGGQGNVCFGNTNTIAGGTNNFVLSGSDVAKFNTMSGGQANFIRASRFSTITGGGGGSFPLNSSAERNIIVEADTGTISGGTQNRLNGSGGTVTGGFSNGSAPLSGKMHGVVTGGSANVADRQGAVVVGGVGNSANGEYSLALGENAKADKDHSMAVNLMKKDGGELLVTEKEGHFVMNAESFRLQIGNGKEKNGAIQSTKMTYENIDNLASVLAEEE